MTSVFENILSPSILQICISINKKAVSGISEDGDGIRKPQRTWKRPESFSRSNGPSAKVNASVYQLQELNPFSEASHDASVEAALAGATYSLGVTATQVKPAAGQALQESME